MFAYHPLGLFHKDAMVPLLPKIARYTHCESIRVCETRSEASRPYMKLHIVGDHKDFVKSAMRTIDQVAFDLEAMNGTKGAVVRFHFKMGAFNRKEILGHNYEKMKEVLKDAHCHVAEEVIDECSEDGRPEEQPIFLMGSMEAVKKAKSILEEAINESGRIREQEAEKRCRRAGMDRYPSFDVEVERLRVAGLQTILNFQTAAAKSTLRRWPIDPIQSPRPNHNDTSDCKDLAQSKHKENEVEAQKTFDLQPHNSRRQGGERVSQSGKSTLPSWSMPMVQSHRSNHDDSLGAKDLKDLIDLARKPEQDNTMVDRKRNDQYRQKSHYSRPHGCQQDNVQSSAGLSRVSQSGRWTIPRVQSYRQSHNDSSDKENRVEVRRSERDNKMVDRKRRDEHRHRPYSRSHGSQRDSGRRFEHRDRSHRRETYGRRY